MKGLKRNLIITEKKKYGFKLNVEKPINVGKLYFLLNIRKRFSNLLGHPVILSSGTLTENVSDFLDHHFQPVREKKNILQ